MSSPTPTVSPAYARKSPYGYDPSLAAGIIFVTLFAAATLCHTTQFIIYRSWWYSLFVMGGICETLGWAGRLWSAKVPAEQNAFLMRISTLVIVPTFISGGIYAALGRLIVNIGRQYSRLTPRKYVAVFVSCDVASLVIQAIGGGMASAASKKVGGNIKIGTNV